MEHSVESNFFKKFKVIAYTVHTSITFSENPVNLDTGI